MALVLEKIAGFQSILAADEQILLHVQEIQTIHLLPIAFLCVKEPIQRLEIVMLLKGTA